MWVHKEDFPLLSVTSKATSFTLSHYFCFRTITRSLALSHTHTPHSLCLSASLLLKVYLPLSLSLLSHTQCYPFCLSNILSLFLCLAKSTSLSPFSLSPYLSLSHTHTHSLSLFSSLTTFSQKGIDKYEIVLKRFKNSQGSQKWRFFQRQESKTKLRS